MDNAGGLGRDFRTEGVGVALELFEIVETAFDAVFVDISRLNAGEEKFPDAAVAKAHWMSACVPVIEHAGDRDGQGGGGPNGKAHTRYAVDGLGVGAKGFPRPVEGAFGVEMKIEIGDDGAEAVGVFDHLFMAEYGVKGELI